MDFDALDDKKTKLFVFIIAPEGETNAHIHLLSNISHTLKSSEVIRAVVAASTVDIAYETILSHTPLTAPMKDRTTKNLVEVLHHFRTI